MSRGPARFRRSQALPLWAPLRNKIAAKFGRPGQGPFRFFSAAMRDFGGPRFYQSRAPDLRPDKTG